MRRVARQADGRRDRNSLERVALYLIGSNGRRVAEYKFAINPNNYKESHPQRATTIRTRSATVVEDYGPDLMTISFGGTTGFRVDSKGKSGADRLFELQDLLERYSVSGHRIDETGNEPTELHFYNYTDGGRYVVHLDTDGFTIERSAERSLLYDYTINLVVLRNTNDPDIRDIDDPALGNPHHESTSEATNPNSRNPVYHTPIDQLRREFP